MNILIVNDDGYTIGVEILLQKLNALPEFKEATIWCCLPAIDQSCKGAAVTVYRHLEAYKVENSLCDNYYKITGTPVDCVHFGISMMRENGLEVDICISGVNIGANLANDWIYSGTVCAALEAKRIGVKAIALSYCGNAESLEHHKLEVSDILGEVFDAIDRRSTYQSGKYPQIHNVNIPDLANCDYSGIEFTTPGVHVRSPEIQRLPSDEFRIKFTLANNCSQHKPVGFNNEVDFELIEKGHVTVTMLSESLN